MIAVQFTGAEKINGAHGTFKELPRVNDRIRFGMDVYIVRTIAHDMTIDANYPHGYKCELVRVEIVSAKEWID